MSVSTPRVTTRKERTRVRADGRTVTTLPCITVSCGCGCNRRIRIYPDRHPELLRQGFATLEIGGVVATVDAWRAILAPLLEGAPEA